MQSQNKTDFNTSIFASEQKLELKEAIDDLVEQFNRIETPSRVSLKVVRTISGRVAMYWRG